MGLPRIDAGVKHGHFPYPDSVRNLLPEVDRFGHRRKFWLRFFLSLSLTCYVPYLLVLLHFCFCLFLVFLFFVFFVLLCFLFSFVYWAGLVFAPKYVESYSTFVLRFDMIKYCFFF